MELSLADLARALAFLLSDGQAGPPDPQTWTRQQTTQALQAISQARAEKYSRIMQPWKPYRKNTVFDTSLPEAVDTDTKPEIDRRQWNRHPCLAGRQAEQDAEHEE